MRLSGGRLVAVGSLIRGGAGSIGNSGLGVQCTNGGDGGHGIRAEPSAAMMTSVTLLDTLPIAGTAGPATGEPCSNGLPGQDMLINAGSVVQLPGIASTLSVKSPVRAGQNTLYAFMASVGDKAATVESPDIKAKLVPMLSGALVPARLGVKRKYAGVLTSSFLSVPRATSLPAGSEFEVTFVQGLITSPGGKPVLGPAHALIVLDPNL